MRLPKKIKSLITLAVVVILLVGAGIVLKNVFLHQIKKEIESNFEYKNLNVSIFPPSLVLEEVKSRTPSPFFSARKISIKISYRSLFTKEKPLNVLIEHPILRIYETRDTEEKQDKRRFSLYLPFSVREGRLEEGEFYYWGKGTSFESQGVDAQFVQRRNTLSFRAGARESILSPGPTWPKIKGKTSLSGESRGREIRIKRMTVEGSDYTFIAEGILPDFFNSGLSLETSFKAKTPFIVGVLGIPFDWQGDAQGEGTLSRPEEGFLFKAKFSSSNLALNKIAMGKVEGKIEVDEKSGPTVEFNIQKKGLPSEYLKIHVAQGKIEGTAQGFYLDPIIKFTPMPWPVGSPAWGDFTVEKGILAVDAEFRDIGTDLGPGRYLFQGRVKFNYHIKDKKMSFSSPELTTSFASVAVEGKVDYSKSVDLEIKGDVLDLKQSRQFTSLILNKGFPFPEIRGRGRANIRIFGDFNSPQVQSSFSLSPGGFAKFDVNSVEGEFEIIKSDFLGRFDVDDLFMEGKIGLISNEEGVHADIRLSRGFVEKILPALDIAVPLQGEASGNFEVKQKNEDVRVEGSFSGPLLRLGTQSLSDVSGKLEWQKGALSLSELQFILYQGRVRGAALVQPLDQKFHLDFAGEEINLSSFYSGLEGILNFSLKGGGLFGKDKAAGPFEIKDLYYYPFQKTEAKGEAKLTYADGTFSLELTGNFLPGENSFNVAIGLPVYGDTVAVDVRGSFANLNLLLPWKGAKGSVNYLGEVRGPKTSPQVKGAIDFQGPLFPLPKFAHAFRDYSGLMFVENNRVSFRSFQAKLGGGDVQGNGELTLADRGVKTINVKFEGENMLLSPLERTRALADGYLNLIKDPGRFVLDGNFSVQKLSWKREVDEKFIFYSSPYLESEREPGFFDDLNLNVRLKSDGNAWMENSLGRIRGRFDLTITGNVFDPIVIGDMEATDGEVYFQDRKFKVLKGQVSFANPSTIEPYISFKGETYVKNYRVTFSLEGLWNRLNPEFSSSPPLPPEDVLALLALGESFQRTYSYDTSTQLSTASLVSFQLSEEAQKRAEGLFIIDRFRIDPFVLGSSAEMAARLTVGKKISRNFSLLYSTNLTSQREEIVRVEWEFTDDLSVVGMRDEKGRFSLDVKIHKRF